MVVGHSWRGLSGFVLYETLQSKVGLGEPRSNVGARQGIAKFVNRLTNKGSLKEKHRTCVNKPAGSYWGVYPWLSQLCYAGTNGLSINVF